MIQYRKYKSSLFACLLLFLLISLNASDLYPCSNAVSLSWIPPATNANGTPVNDVYGYKLYYGNSPRNYTSVIDVGNQTVYKLCDLTVGATYYFAVTAYDIYGNESEYSYEVNKLIAPSTNSPVADFTAYMTGGTAPLTVNFINSTAGGNAPFTYAWDFDNSGGTADSTLQNPSCIFNNKASGGTYLPYTVKLTVTGGDGGVGAMIKTGYISVCYSSVNIVGSTKTYKSLQSAYNSAKDGNMIQSRAESITENVDFNLPKMMTIRGGYNCNHSSITGKTVINGNVRISNGKVTIEDVTVR